MKYFRYLFIGICFMLFFPMITRASCDYERAAELSKIAGNIQFNYSYDVDSNDFPIFTVNMTNVTNDIYVVDETDGTIVRESEHGFVYDFTGTTIDYRIYSNDDNCKDELISTKSITIPHYNGFSALDDCLKYPNFKYCQTWLNTENLSQDDFNDELENYIQKMNNSSSSIAYEENRFLDFIVDNLFFIVLAIVGIVTVPILIHLKRRL